MIDLARAEQVAAEFLTAFDRLHWDAFFTYMVEETTIFFPFEDVPARAKGRAAIQTVFEPFFEKVRLQRPGPSYLAIRPLDLDIQLLEDCFVATFHLDDGETFSRRTAIFANKQQGWKLLHLHASNLKK